MTTEFKSEDLKEINITASASGHDEDVGEVTVHIFLGGKWNFFTEWFSIKTLEMETSDTQTTSGNSDGYDALHEHLENLYGDGDDFEFWALVNERANVLLGQWGAEQKAKAFESKLDEIGISLDEFISKIEISRQTYRNWKNSGNFPAHIKYTLMGMEAEKKGLL
ncbi:hypothetical protein [Vibrio crassostreae]|uniref:hypothetical protein n=1 Tax=Vibrio crassostreae TaxID=246167 RepID=UPI001B30DA37|nr:hypothetical protein [Vibrio crassostreae]